MLIAAAVALATLRGNENLIENLIESIDDVPGGGDLRDNTYAATGPYYLKFSIVLYSSIIGLFFFILSLQELQLRLLALGLSMKFCLLFFDFSTLAF